MANFCFLRNTISFLCILCCLFLPLTVEWVPRHSNMLNYKSSNSNQNYLYDDYGLSSAGLFQNEPEEAIENFTLCKKVNSTTLTTLTYYHFELHILVYLIAILSCSTFIQMYFYSKLFMMFTALCIYIIGFNFNMIYDCLAESMAEHVIRLPFLKAQIFIQMFFFIMFLHLIDRRVIFN
jgi:hypothetical protein